MDRGLVVLVGGGVRSGKSAFAERRALTLAGTERPVYIATAETHDDEMRARVTRHRLDRGDAFVTRECPRALPEELERCERGAVVLVDCLTLWLSNLLCAELDHDAVLARFDALTAVIARRACHVVMVTNEVGLGIVPDNALARRFRDLAGILHQRIGAQADEVYFAVLGQLLRLKPAPISLAEQP